MSSDYTLEQIKAMQNEATQRVRELNERSKNIVDRSRSKQNTTYYGRNGEYFPGNKQDKPNEKEEKQCVAPSPPTKKSPFGLNFLKSLDLRSIIGENSEQTILLLLILLLMNENNADEILIFALIYIML